MDFRHVILLAILTVSVASGFSLLGCAKFAWDGMGHVAKLGGVVKDFINGKGERSISKREIAAESEKAKDQHILAMKRTDSDLEQARAKHDHLMDTNEVERLRIHGNVAISKMNNAKDITVAALEANSKEVQAQTASDITTRFSQVTAFGIAVYGGVKAYETCSYYSLESGRIEAELEKTRMYFEKANAEGERKHKETMEKMKMDGAKELAETTERMNNRSRKDMEKMTTAHEEDMEFLTEAQESKKKSIASKEKKTKKATADRLSNIDQNDHRLRQANARLDSILEYAEKTLPTGRKSSHGGGTPRLGDGKEAKAAASKGKIAEAA